MLKRMVGLIPSEKGDISAEISKRRTDQPCRRKGKSILGRQVPEPRIRKRGFKGSKECHLLGVNKPARGRRRD